MAWPITMPVSSTLWCMSMCRSPSQRTVRSMAECLEKLSSIWSKNPIPVWMSDFPVPSRPTVTVMSVSLVLRLTVAVRFWVMAADIVCRSHYS